MNEKLLGILCVLLNCILVPFGQYYWKKALTHGYSISVFLTANFILGCIFFITGTLVWLYALSVFPFSKVYPFLSLSFLVGVLIGAMFLGEKVTLLNYSGVLLLVVSLFLIAHR